MTIQEGANKTSVQEPTKNETNQAMQTAIDAESLPFIHRYNLQMTLKNYGKSAFGEHQVPSAQQQFGVKGCQDNALHIVLIQRLGYEKKCSLNLRLL